MTISRVFFGGIAAVASLTLCACYEGNPDEVDDGSTSGSESADGSTTAPSSTTSTTTSTSSSGCLLGQEGCECLDGQCAGLLVCVENGCKRAPEFDGPDDPLEVIAGLRVPIEVEVNADSFMWTQAGGPTVGLENPEGQTVLVNIPPDTANGETITLRIAASRNGIEGSFDVNLSIIPANFENALPTIMDPEQLGTVQSVNFRGNDVWVTSSEGYVAWFDAEGTYRGRHDIPGQPMGSRMGGLPQGDYEDDLDVLYVANAANEAIEAVVLSNGDVRTITSQTVDGTPLGAVHAVVPAGDGDLFFTNPETNQIFHYDDELGETTIFATDVGTFPTALSFGPDVDVLYVGSLGRVWRLPVLNDGLAGEPSVYLQLGPQDDLTLEVSAILFDAGQSMYVATPLASALHLARYKAGDATTVIREFTDVGGSISEFTGLAFGDGDFGDGTLYYGNPTSAAVGRVRVGLGR